MVRGLVGALLAAVVLFVWGFVYWDVSPLKFWVMRALPDGAGLAQALNERIPHDGIYFYPGFDPELHARDPGAERERLLKQYAEGPIVQVVLHKGGIGPMPLSLAQGFAHQFVWALVAAGLLTLTAPPSYLGRVILVTGIGLFAAVGMLQQAIWLNYPWYWVLFQAGSTAGGWFVAGLVLAAVVKPKPA